MKILRIITTFVFCLFFLLSCFRCYEEYGFKSTENVLSWGSVGAKLKGTKKNLPNLLNTVVKSSPYNLSISFISKTITEGSIHIIGLRLIYAESKKVVFEKNDIAEKPFEKAYKSIYGAFFRFKNIKTEYEDMVLRVKFLLKQGSKSTEYNTEIYFEKEYRKFRRIIGV